MSFLECIHANDGLNAAQKREIERDYQRRFERYSQTMGSVEAASASASHVVMRKRAEFEAKNRAAINDVLRFQELTTRMNNIADAYALQKNAAGKKGAWVFQSNPKVYAARQLMEEVHNAQISKEREYTIMIGEAIEKYRSQWFGLTQDTDGFRSVVREMLGADTGNAAAKATAQEIAKVFEFMREDFIAAGGVMGKREGYFPQRHTATAIAPATMHPDVAFARWYDTIMPLLDWNKMINESTGLPFFDVPYNELPLERASEVRLMMREVFENIRSQGLNDIIDAAQEGKVTFGKGGGVQLLSPARSFIFKGADAFLQYNSQYGTGDEGLFDAMMGYMQSMARDVGMMKHLGAKPRNQFSRLELATIADGATSFQLNQFRSMWRVASGEMNGRGEKAGGFFHFFRGLGHFTRTALLGKAAITTLTDVAYLHRAAKINGLPQASLLKSYAKLLNPLDASDRRFARRHILIAHSASGNSMRQAKYAVKMGLNRTDTLIGRFDNLGGAISGFQHRFSGMATIADSAAQSGYMAAGGVFEEYRIHGIGYDELPSILRDSLKRFGIEEDDYAAIMRGTPVEMEEGVGFLLPEGMRVEDREAAFKYQMWLSELSMMASNENRLFTTALMTGGEQFGTAGRAIRSSVMMFKGFMVTQLINHTLPMLRKGFADNAWGEFAGYTVALTLLGGMVIQMKSIIGGYDSEEMDKPDFWGRAMMQGGGLGLFGEFFLNDYTQHGNSIGETFAGATIGTTMTDLYRLFFSGNFGRALEPGTKTDFAADFVQFAHKYTPAVNVWYVKLLMDRTVFDAIERAVDPNFDRRMRRFEKRKQEERGAEPWWGAGG